MLAYSCDVTYAGVALHADSAAAACNERNPAAVAQFLPSFFTSPCSSSLQAWHCMQTLGLLPAEMDPGAVAQFLRSCPGLNKQTTGELLGEYDEFFLEVLRHFTDTFDFTGEALLRLA